MIKINKIQNLEGKIDSLPTGDVLMIQPRYAFSRSAFEQDSNPYLPIGALYAGALLEGTGKATVSYHDSQRRELSKRKDLSNYDTYGITVMGASNIASAGRTYQELLSQDIEPSKIYFGGQGIEGLTQEEFQRLFPGANLVSRSVLADNPNYWSTNISPQLEKLAEEDIKKYFENEVTLLFSQGCKYDCTFCGAQTKQKEEFFGVADQFRSLAKAAKKVGIYEIKAYVTSLDFFQQALKGGDVGRLEKLLNELKEAQEETGVSLKFRALSRADSYMAATKYPSIMDAAKKAGFYQCGLGADGAASVEVLKAMKKGNTSLRSTLIEAFADMEKRGIAPEILYVFGVGADTPKTLEDTLGLCSELLTEFPTSIYRGFPAKDFIPGNRNWRRSDWKQSSTHSELLNDSKNFINLDFTSLGNYISHPNEEMRKEVNRVAIEMSAKAHELGRVQSFLTIPEMTTDGRELMSEESFERLREIIAVYSPVLAEQMTLENLPELREKINANIPKDR